MTASRKALIRASLAATAVILPFALKSTLPQTATAATSPTEAEHSEAPDPGINPDMAAAMVRDLGIRPEKIPAYVKKQARASEIDAEAQRVLGRHYAGTWMETDANGEPRIVVATDLSTHPLRFSGADEVRHVEFSMAELNTAVGAMNHLDTTGKQHALSNVRGWGVDVAANAVRIRVAKGHEHEAINFAALSGIDPRAVRISSTAGVNMTTAYTVGGAQRFDSITSGGYSPCSVGFAVTKVTTTSTTNGFITAGHCFINPYGSKWSGKSSALYKAGDRWHGATTETTGSVQSANFGGTAKTDMAWSKVTNTLAGSVHNYGYRTTTITTNTISVKGSTEEVQGSAVCRFGFASGWSCGEITLINASETVDGNIKLAGMRESNACTTQGDSGGPWLSATGHAQGVTSGGSLSGTKTYDDTDADGLQVNAETNCNEDQADRTTFYQPVKPILTKYALTLKTS